MARWSTQQQRCIFPLYRRISIHSRIAFNYAHSFDHDTCHDVWLTTWDLTILRIGQKTPWGFGTWNHSGTMGCNKSLRKWRWLCIYYIYDIYMNTISLSLSIYIWPLKIRFRSSSINVFLDIKWNPPGTRSDIDYGNDINCQHMNSVLEVCKTWLVFRFISNKWKHCCNHFPKHLCKLQGDSGQVGPSEPPRKCWKSLSWCLKSAMNFYTTSQGPWLWGPCCLFHWIIKETQPRAFQIFKSLLS